jgi:hypothetical protein
MPIREHWLIPDEPFQTYAAYQASWEADAIRSARGREPERVLRQIQRSGLRGRGGAGFPTGTKWATVARHECPTRQVVCNAAEGEPGTFKDRWLLRKNPYAVIEGMLIAAHVVGAEQLFIALKGSFAPELARVRAALDEMRDVIGHLEVQLIEGPEEYLFGEERALLEVIEGNEPLPREAHYPPYERGLFATPRSPNPAVVNNAETYAHVPSIVRKGAASFRELGTADTPGTMLFWYPNRPGSSLNSIQSTHLWGYSKLQGSEVGRGLPHLGAREIERLQRPGVRWLGMLADDEARLDRGRDALVQHGITWRLVRRRALTAGRHTVYFELLELGAGREDVATTRRP